MDKHMPLISLRRRKLNSTGAILCLPGAGDGVTSFVELAAAMNHNIPIYGLQPRGLLDDQEPYLSIADMVSKYIEVVSSQVGNGPYYIVGHSFGGYVALELAESLKNSGCEVAPLILLDVSPPESPHIHKSRIESLLSLIETMELVSENCFNLPFETLAPLDEKAQLQIIHARMVSNGLIPKQSQFNSIHGMVKLFIANGHMEYWPTKNYEGPALYVNALDTKEDETERYKNFERWLKFIPKLKYVESRGNHITLMNRQNVGGLVKILEHIWGL